MFVRFRGATSKSQDMPGGAPQGTLLGGILYILDINPVGFPAEITNHPEITSVLQFENWLKSSDIGCHKQPAQPSQPVFDETMNKGYRCYGLTCPILPRRPSDSLTHKGNYIISEN